MIGKLLLGLWIIRWLSLCGFNDVIAYDTLSQLDESYDELHDAEIFRAVVESMRQWEMHRKSHRTKREASRVCYEDVGCFEDAGPFSYLEMLPSHPKEVGTRFLVYGSRKARSIPTEVPAEEISEKVNHAVDPELPTKVIVHGFGSSCDHVWVYEMRSALMSVHECNIVCVDWGPGSAVPNYVRAAANTRLVGRQLAKLVKSLNVPLEKVHLIGFSLGAHVAGFAGAELGNVSRITGLDPAGPLFEAQDPRARLDETDANFVDVIHSNGEQLILGGLGSWQPMGDVDFYPNGGRMQTGCSNLFLGAVSDIIWSSAVEGRSLCNHRRAYKLFTDSVSPKCRFPAFPCEYGYDGLLKGECFPCSVNGVDKPCGDMGYYSDTSPARGQLYLITRDEEPFCAHQFQVKVYNSRGERPVRSYGKLQVTLVGEGSFNDTFTMTRKDDEELLVGAILQKIVVPHPAVTNLEGIEVKYTAYSGWISSGLSTWSIDKVTVTDSFGKTLSICKRGLILESGYPVYLPLYAGECNTPIEVDNVTATLETVPEKTVHEKQSSGGIGPFTKEQNYENKENFPEILASERTNVQKGLGPFTRNQNLKVFEDKESIKSQNSFVVDSGDYVKEGSKAYQSSPWSYIDLSNDGSSNSLENSDSEKGRGFSSFQFVPKPSATAESSRSFDVTTTEVHHHTEIKEPVLRPTKKETGRSMKLPEITEPILRPRSTRQNSKNEAYIQDKKHEILEESSTSSRAFTVQFLPERLAGILAQAERYARQTLLPLISQYTPSFVGGSRFDRPKYFPPLSSFFESHTKEDTTVLPTEAPQSKKGRHLATTTEASRKVVVQNEAKVTPPTKSTSKAIGVVVTSTTETTTTVTEDTDWVPIDKHHISDRNVPANKSNGNETSYEGGWFNEDGGHWKPQVEDTNAGPETKIDDWVPIIEKKENVENQTAPTTSSSESTDAVLEASSTTETPEQPTTTTRTDNESTTEDDFRKDPFFKLDDDRKFIPLLDFADTNEFNPPTTNNDVEHQGTTEKMMTHIQRIPRRGEVKPTEKIESRSLMFPYVYDRKTESRRKYIPLINEHEDMVSSMPIIEMT